MVAKPNGTVRDLFVPTIGLFWLITSIDKTNSILVLLCWAFYTIQEMGFIWLNSQITTCTYQLLTAVIPRRQALPVLIRLCGAKVILSTTHSAIALYRRYTERQIKRKLKKKMTLLLLEAFLRLNYPTQCNAQVMRDFMSARGIVNGPIVRTLEDIMRLVVYVLRAVIICFSFALQLCDRERLAALPFIVLWLFVDLCVKQGPFYIYEADMQVK